VDVAAGGKRSGAAKRNRRTLGGGLSDHPPVFGDCTLRLVVRNTCSEPENALRNCLSSVALLSCPHIARHRRARDTPVIFVSVVVLHMWCTRVAR